MSEEQANYTLFEDACPMEYLVARVKDMVSEKTPGTLGFSAGVDVLSFANLTQGTNKARKALESYIERFSGIVEL